MRVLAVHRSGRHDFSKDTVGEIELEEGLGVVGDAHHGVSAQHRSIAMRNPGKPNLRQVHLIHAELLDDLAPDHVVPPGALGENVTTRGIDLLGLPVGARLRLGDDAVVTVTGLRNPCVQIDRYSPGLLKRVVHTDDDGATVRLTGVMSIVSRPGIVRADDPIVVELPPGRHRRLTTV